MLSIWQRMIQRKSQWLICVLINEESSHPLTPRDGRVRKRCSKSCGCLILSISSFTKYGCLWPRRTGGQPPAQVAGGGGSLSSSSPSLLSFLIFSDYSFFESTCMCPIAPDTTHQCAGPESLPSRPAPHLQAHMRLLSWALPCPNPDSRNSACQTSFTSPQPTPTLSSSHIPDVKAGTFEVIHLFNTTLMLPACQALSQELRMLRNETQDTVSAPEEFTEWRGRLTVTEYHRVVAGARGAEERVMGPASEDGRGEESCSEEAPEGCVSREQLRGHSRQSTRLTKQLSSLRLSEGTVLCAKLEERRGRADGGKQETRVSVLPSRVLPPPMGVVLGGDT